MTGRSRARDRSRPSGGGARWTPASISGLRLWLRPSVGVTRPGGFVSAWADQSGNGNSLLQSSAVSQPAYSESPAAVDFDGTNDRMTGASIASYFTTSWTMLGVIELDGLAASAPNPRRDAAVFHDTNGYAALTLRSNAGTPQCGSYRLTTGAVYTTMQGTGVKQVVSASYDHSTGTLLVQAGLNTPQTLVGTPDNTQAGTGAIGGFGAMFFGSAYFNGRMFDVCVWNRSLSTDERQSMIRGAARANGVVV